MRGTLVGLVGFASRCAVVGICVITAWNPVVLLLAGERSVAQEAPELHKLLADVRWQHSVLHPSERRGPRGRGVDFITEENALYPIGGQGFASEEETRLKKNEINDSGNVLALFHLKAIPPEL